MEYKSLPTFTKAIEGRAVTGIMAVHGHRDDGGDISHPGSFTKTIVEGQARVAGQPRYRYLWNHNSDMFAGPPIAVIKALREIGRDELPEQVLAWAPDATGGVEITREYLDTPRGEEVFKGLLAGAVDEMSYGYDAVKWDMGELNGQPSRNLREVRLWEGSDVLWGMNAATLGSKGLLPDINIFLKQIEQYAEEIKAGARHSATDTKLLNAIHKAAVSLGATDCKGIVEEDNEEDEADKEKSRADAMSLTLAKSWIDILELETSIHR